MSTTPSPWSPTRRWRAWLVACLMLATTGVQAAADVALADPAAALRARYIVMQDALRDSPFGRPLQLDSRESRARIEGDVYVVTNHVFPALATEVTDAASWCAILSLHQNVKRCSASAGVPASSVIAYVGGKHDEPSDATHRLEFAHRTEAEARDYVKVVLDGGAALGTRDQRIVLEAIPITPEVTFIHLSYSYAYGPVAALAMRAYLGTAGASKVGFTVIGRRPDGLPVLVGGMRGALERNVMRYFLALDTYLDARATPSAGQRERQLFQWFAATERYPQLHELSLDEYLQTKQVHRAEAGR